MILSQSHARLSMLALGAAAIAAVPASAAGLPPSSYAGRWTVTPSPGDTVTGSVRSRWYSTIDVARCGPAYCGVGVDNTGKCGPVMFRLAAANNAPFGDEQLVGRGRWGDETKYIVAVREKVASGPMLRLYLGDGANVGSRSGSMPLFYAGYRRLGPPRCTA